MQHCGAPNVPDKSSINLKYHEAQHESGGESGGERKKNPSANPVYIPGAVARLEACPLGMQTGIGELIRAVIEQRSSPEC